MLFHNTIAPPTLELLNALQAAPAFAAMRLVGGTGLALQIGHRKSVDIDLFGRLEADALQVESQLRQCGPITILGKSQNVWVYSINGIKVDIVNYPYSWLEDPITEERLVIAGMQDIAAMKLSAITNRGTKKDFVDIFFLLNHFSLAAMLDLYLEKYHDGAAFMVLKSLTYFDDAENEPMPMMLQPVAWDAIKTRITVEVETF